MVSGFRFGERWRLTLPVPAVRIIAFDTATDDTVVAALDGAEVIARFRAGPDSPGRPRHSADLLGAIGDAVGRAGGWERIARIAVGTGPGTFTGIRIGIATATGLARSTGTPLVGVSTLAALAVSIAQGAPGEGPVMPVLDARRGQVFTGLYNPAGRELEPPAVCAPDELTARLARITARLPDPPRIGGSGSLRFREQLEQAGFPVPEARSAVHRLSGRALCRLGAGIPDFELGKPLEPIYLRAPDAQVWLQRDRPGNPPGS